MTSEFLPVCAKRLRTFLKIKWIKSLDSFKYEWWLYNYYFRLYAVLRLKRPIIFNYKIYSRRKLCIFYLNFQKWPCIWAKIVTHPSLWNIFIWSMTFYISPWNAIDPTGILQVFFQWPWTCINDLGLKSWHTLWL